MKYPRTAAMAVAACLLLAAPAEAATRCTESARIEAVKLAKSAKSKLEIKDHDGALKDLESAYSLCPQPQLRHAMGRVLEEADRPAEALEAFGRCVDEGAEGETRKECEARVASLKAHLSTGKLVVAGAPQGALVFIDGAGEGRQAGVEAEVAAGKHEIAVRAEGMAPWAVEVVVPGGATARIEARLVPLVEQTPVVAAAPRNGAGTTWNWIGLGAGAALALGSVPFFAQYFSDKADRRDALYDGQGNMLREADTVSPANLILGGALAATGAGVAVASLLLWPDAKTTAVGVLPQGGVIAVFAF